jgi:hypothetical protein
MKRSRSHRSRRGTVYLLVLSGAALLTLAGVGALLAMKAERAIVDREVRTAEIRMAAQSALELGMQQAENTQTWRTARAGNTPFVNFTLNGATGTSTIRGSASTATDALSTTIDPTETNPAWLYADAVNGQAYHRAGVRLTPYLEPCGAIDHVVAAGGAVSFSSITLYGSGSIHSGTSISLTGSTVWPSLRSVGAINLTSSTVVNGRTTPTTSVSMPEANVVQRWTVLGTSIPIASIQSRRLSKVVLSPAQNPFGAPNSSGIYVIDCGGRSIDIQDVRVIGTLVLINASSVLFSNAFSIEAINGQPTIVTNATTLDIQSSTSTLTEQNLAKNFNPIGAAYQGVTDNDQTDAYPSVIYGVVFTEGNVTVRSGTLEGVLIARGTIQFSAAASTLRYVRPPAIIPGFTSRTAFMVDEASLTVVPQD